MPDIRNAYPDHGDLTITLASLASDTNLLVGRQSTEVVNTTTKFIDFLISGRITTGTSPTGGTIEVWAVAAFDTLGTTYPDTVTNAGDLVRTWTNSVIKNSAAKLIYSVSPTTVNNISYPWSGISIAGLYNGTCPPRFVVYVTQSTGVALNSTASNHLIRLQPVYRTVS